MSSLAAKYNAKDSRPEHGTNRKSSSRDKGVSTRHSDIMQQKVGRMLRDELSDIIASGDIKANVYPDERLLRGVTIDDIDFASDLTTAKVSLSILGNSVEKRQVYVWLCNNIGQVRFELSQRLRDLRRVPEIRFTLVDTQSAQYLNSVLDEIAEANSRSGGGTGSAGAQPGLVDFEEADDAD
jgi:ribosome-binding factor A